MGADSTVVVYGIRIPTTESESRQLQLRADPRILRARDHQLAHWWGKFSVDEYTEQEYLFIGTLIGHVGHEGKYEILLRDDDLLVIARDTRQKLAAAGFEGEPTLYIQFEPDE